MLRFVLALFLAFAGCYGDSEEPSTFENGHKGYEVTLSAYSADELHKLVYTGSFPEYTSASEMRGHLQRAMVASGSARGPIYVDFGFHQESADEYSGVLSDTRFNFQKHYPGVLRFSTVSAIAKGTKRN